jgi:hypothetical protein
VISPDKIFVHDGGPHFAHSVTSCFISRLLSGNWTKLWVAVVFCLKNFLFKWELSIGLFVYVVHV